MQEVKAAKQKIIKHLQQNVKRLKKRLYDIAHSQPTLDKATFDQGYKASRTDLSKAFSVPRWYHFCMVNNISLRTQHKLRNLCNGAGVEPVTPSNYQMMQYKTLLLMFANGTANGTIETDAEALSLHSRMSEMFAAYLDESEDDDAEDDCDDDYDGDEEEDRDEDLYFGEEEENE